MTPEHQSFVAAFQSVDPNLANIIESLLDGASLPIVKMRVRAAVSSLAHTNQTQHIRDDLASILETVVADGLDQPRDLDVAIDAILSATGRAY